jgi:D-alanine-D-alanine ligase
MDIGLTYDLRSEYLAAGYSEEDTAEFDRDDTIDSIATALEELGHQPVRIGNARQLIERLAAGDRWDLVFNICEGLFGIGREAQVPAILDVYQIPYTFSDPLVMAVCLHKGLTKTVVRDAGVPTAPFAVIHELSDLDDMVDSTRRVGQGRAAAAGPPQPHPAGGPALAARAGPTLQRLEFPVFAKPVAEGTGKGVDATSKITRAADLRPTCQRLLQRYQQPVLVEQFLPGREFTVGIVGTGAEAQAVGTLEIVLLPGAEPDAYSYINKEQCEELVEYRLVHADRDAVVRRAEELAVQGWRALNCRDGGRIDLRCDAAGQPQFLEANPLAGLHPQHSDLPMLFTALGKPYQELIRLIVDSAAQRVTTQRRSSSMC